MSRPARRDFIYERGNVRIGRILEIGALDSPTFPDRQSRYLDWFSRSELLDVLSENKRRYPERIVDPEYVVKDKRFASHVPDHFDIVIANHVIEHVADPLTWLQQIRAVAPRGDLFLAVPDRRYTFDYLRPDSTVAQLLQAHADDLQMPSQWQVLDAIYYYRPLRAEQVWQGDLTALDQPRYSLREALERSRRAHTEYMDAHCHVFSASTFADLLTAVQDVVGWHPVEVTDVAEGSNEFYAWLKPNDLAPLRLG